MPKITFAYDYENHKAETTADVPEHVARMLLNEGRARLTPQAQAAAERAAKARTPKKARAPRTPQPKAAENRRDSGPTEKKD